MRSGNPLARVGRASRPQEASILSLLRGQLRAVLVTFGLVIGATISYYVLLVYMPTFAKTQLKIGLGDAFTAQVIGLSVLTVVIPLVGHLSDLVGRRAILIWSGGLGTVSLVEATAGPIMPYRSVKAALVPFMKSLAIDGAPKNVRANMVSPGTILEDGNTWGRQRDANTERYQRSLARNPMGRMGTPQEVANCVVFLAGTPADIVGKLNADLVSALNQPDVKAKLLDQGLFVQSSTPEALAALLKKAGAV
mgnify:CR=1 FL=1